jgi:hypothetical protein
MTFERANEFPSRLRPIGSYFPSLSIRSVCTVDFPQTSSTTVLLAFAFSQLLPSYSGSDPDP